MAVDAFDGSEAWVVSLNGTINTSLATRDTSLWVGTLEGELFRINVQTGELLHTYELGQMPYGSPLVLEHSLLLLLEGITLARVSTDDGSALWELTAADEWSSFKPMLYDDLVWVGDAQGQLVGVSLGSGKPERTLTVNGTIRGFHIEEGVAYVGTLQGKMHAMVIER